MAKCFGRNGIETSSLFLCNAAAAAQGKHTSCCGSNQLCLTNGMCRNVGISDATNFDWIGGCTDRSFDDPACAKYCGLEGGLVWQCTGSETYCCHTGTVPKYNDRKDRTNLTCCSISELVFQAPNPTVFATAQAATLSLATLSVVTLMTSSVVSSGSMSSSWPSTNASPTTSSAATSAAVNILESPSNPALASPTSSLTIGLGAGLGAAATIALVVGLVFFWRRKAAVRSKAEKEKYEMMGVIPVEVSGAEKPLELQRSRSPIEMFVRTEAVELPCGRMADGKEEKRARGIF